MNLFDKEALNRERGKQLYIIKQTSRDFADFRKACKKRGIGTTRANQLIAIAKLD